MTKQNTYSMENVNPCDIYKTAKSSLQDITENPGPSDFAEGKLTRG